MRRIVGALRSGVLKGEAAIVISNNPDAPALQFARDGGIPARCLNSSCYAPAPNLDRAIADALAERNCNLVVLSGYMRKLGPETIARFRGRILNIHPALLPKIGGQGMYGMRVHEAVLAAGEKATGITVHIVDDEYDCGPILAQHELPVLPGDTPERLARRVADTEPSVYIDVLGRLQCGMLGLPLPAEG
jgi:phosphoribosylglycinamide formyltransferase-1